MKVSSRCFVALVAVGCSGPLAGADEGAFFDSQVLPILQKRCFECHSHASKIKGGLALDSRAGWAEGGDSGPAIEPGKPDDSLLITAIRYADGDYEMPPKGKLPDAEIAVLEEWVRRGAADPRAGSATATKKGIDLEEGRKFWAYQPVRDPEIPAVRDTAWPLDPVDRFILAKQEEQGIGPGADADRYTWLRRVSLDLTGLPPAAQEIRDFVADESPEAHEKVVDRLLASKAFGERWARHWLDLTGYADMMGTSNDVCAEHAWRYRDYLIRAFNDDKPFDEFVREQIAGDLLPAASPGEQADKIVATGFLMVGDVEIVNPDRAKLEADHIDSQVNKIGIAFMGQTLGCVRCHDHKFDPIGLEDYYGIAGMLKSSPSTQKFPRGVWSVLNVVVLPESAEALAARQKLEAEEAARIQKLKDEKATLVAERTALDAKAADTPEDDDSADAEGEDADDRDAKQEKAVADARAARLDEIKARVKAIDKQVKHAEYFRDKRPKAYAMQDGPQPADMPVFIRGNAYAHGPVVPRGAIRVVSWEAFPSIPAGQSGRLQLAEWLADERHPLTARVAVNRIWQKLFGTGIVPSVDYFGTRGESPSHPELLDHLASRFMSGGWSQKALIRSLVLSRTYRLSADGGGANPGQGRAVVADPENKLFWRMNRQRIDAEALRDSLLAVTGELKPGGEGPALVSENPDNFINVDDGPNPPGYRHNKGRPGQDLQRTVYLPVMRIKTLDADRVRTFFDFVNPAEITGQRNQTVVPTQSLYLLNNALIRRRAEVLAEQLLAGEGDDEARIAALWLRVLSRPVSSAERGEAASFLADMRRLLPAEAGVKTPDHVAWTELCHGLLACNEFVFRL